MKLINGEGTPYNKTTVQLIKRESVEVTEITRVKNSRKSWFYSE